jgi:beta-glucosidase
MEVMMSGRIISLVISLSLSHVALAGAQEGPLWKDTSKLIEDRVRHLVSQLTLEEKMAQLQYDAPAISRLGIPEYNWWSECLHGVARNGRATVFPQAIGLAATFDEDLIFRIAAAIATEARAKFNATTTQGHRGRYAGLTFWTPNVNLFRDPRWGRGQETYGEDPYLTSRIGVAFVKGLQGDHPKYMKAAACAKHYVVHSGPEGLRHEFDAVPSRKDFRETYLPAFKALVTEAKVEAVMCAYNRTFSEPCCGSSYLLQDILRNEWGFKGHIVSDCWAIRDFHENHEVTSSHEESAALAIKSGVNVNCGSVFADYLARAVEQGLVTEREIDKALYELLPTRFKLGLFDPPEMNPWKDLGPEVVEKDEHVALAREAATKSVVLLKNANDTLPLAKDLNSIFVLGPNAADVDVLYGNYHGLSKNMVTILEGLTATVSTATALRYRHTFLLDRDNINPIDWGTDAAGRADATIVVMGISTLLEGEEGESIASPTKGDRFTLDLPPNQVEFLRKVREAAKNKPVIVVLTGGSPVTMPEVHELADAVVWVWYPGQEGGNAVADILFGNAVPSGRLPITFPKSIDQLPPYEDYGMKGRTYRYMTEEPLYPFGFGLSYTTFEYSDLTLSSRTIRETQPLTARVTVTNTGSVAGEEVVQLYLTDVEASVDVPLFSLQGIERMRLQPGESKNVEFTVTTDMLEAFDEEGRPLLEEGAFRVTIGGAVPSDRALALGGPKPLMADFRLE